MAFSATCWERPGSRLRPWPALITHAPWLLPLCSQQGQGGVEGGTAPSARRERGDGGSWGLLSFVLIWFCQLCNGLTQTHTYTHPNQRPFSRQYSLKNEAETFTQFLHNLQKNSSSEVSESPCPERHCWPLPSWFCSHSRPLWTSCQCKRRHMAEPKSHGGHCR